MKNSKTIVLATIGLLVIGGLSVFALRSDDKAADNNTAASQTTSQQSTANIPKTETEKTLDSYTGDEFDRFYITNMTAHHQAAVDMAKLAQVQAKHSELKTLADDIITAQTKEMNDMLAWQKAWGYPPASGDMAVDHSAKGAMSNMATIMSTLESKTGDEFDKAFLQQMIIHHESAVAMSRPGIKNAGHQEVKDLSKAVIDAQTREISKMRQWQKDWGYES